MRILVASASAASLITAIRLRTPLERVAASEGWELRFESFPFVRTADLVWGDVLVVQRGTSRRHLHLMQAMQRRGGAVIADIDDLLTEPAFHLIEYVGLKRSVVWVQRCLAAADVVTVSTSRLGAALMPYAQQIETVPNYAHALPGTNLPKPQLGQPDTVLLATSDSLASTALFPVLRRLANERGALLQIVCVGPAADSATAAGLLVQRYPILPRHEFLALARSLPNVVAAIPLDSSRFSSCKSAIKWFDYAEAGIPTLTSKLPPYADVIEDGRTGALVEDSADSWLAALRHALDDECWRQKIASQAREHVRAFHGLGFAEAAWIRAIEKSLTLRRPVATGSWTTSALRDVLETLNGRMVALRRLNRVRLEARRARRSR